MPKDKKICEYQMNEEEKQECKDIVAIIRACEPEERFDYGNPIYECGTNRDGSTRYLAGGDCYHCIMAINRQNGYGFDYYVVAVGDRGEFCIYDYKAKYDQMSKESALIHREAFLHFLLSVLADPYNRETKEEYILFNHYCVKAIPAQNGYYCFEMIHSYGSEIENDKVFEEVCSGGEPIFLKKECSSCYTKWFFNGKYLKADKKYVCECPKCKARMA